MTQDANTRTKKPKMSRGWRAILIVSLGLNLAVAGLVAGAAFKHGGPRDRFDPMVRALDSSTRREVGRTIRAHRSEGRGSRAELNAAFGEILTALRAPEFDANALRAAMQKKSAVLHQTRDVGEAALVAHFEQLSLEERAAFATRLEDILNRKKKR